MTTAEKNNLHVTDTVNTNKPVAFCDFDGTITMKDNLLAIMNEFAPPSWELIKHDIVSEKITIQEGVRRMFALIPSAKQAAMLHYLEETATYRDGFTDFVSYTKSQGIPLYVVSGGIDFFVRPMLARFHIDPHHIYCNGSDFSEPEIEILWPNACDDHCDGGCGCCKPSLMRRLGGEHKKIVIGDSVTDFKAAGHADFVFARDHLLQLCQEQEWPHQEYKTFYEIINGMKEKGW